MRLAFRIDLISRAPCLAIFAALVLNALPLAASAQTTPAAPAQSATLAESGDAAGSSSASGQIAAPPLTDTDSQVAANATSARDDAASVNDISLDDQVLSRQRGGAVGMLMVAATPQLMQGGGNQVTLWDEIAPPSPLPIPVDAARAAQGNVATYQRK
ncbi:hypothetical protein [Paraburkholderia sp.]|uniref:hypothetical protein n=1 Tax=Paraburkholderia sp. TaxID=1926495 RepID=UPI0039E302A7